MPIFNLSLEMHAIAIMLEQLHGFSFAKRYGVECTPSFELGENSDQLFVNTTSNTVKREN